MAAITLGQGTWTITTTSGVAFTIDGILAAQEMNEVGLVPYVKVDNEAFVFDPRAAIRDSAGRLVWDGRPLD